MSRSSRRLTDAQARELAALERALAGAPAPEDDARVAAVVVGVREDRELPRAAFAAELDRRAAAGFPRRGRKRAVRWQWLTGAGVATLVVVAAAVALVVAPGPQSAGPTAPRPQDLRAPASAPSAPSGGGAASVQAPASAGPTAPALPPQPLIGPPTDARPVQRGASLTLVAPRGRVQQVTDQAIATVDRLGGIVASSNVSVDDAGGSSADVELSVPSGELDQTLAALSALAHVSSRSQSTLDITDPTAAARARLAESRAERAGLLRSLANATTANQVASIRARLGLLTGRIGQDEAQLMRLVGQARSAQVSLTINEDTQAGAGGSSAWDPTVALGRALEVLEGAFAILVITFAASVPVGVVAVATWLVARALRRRRRGEALGSTSS